MRAAFGTLAGLLLAGCSALSLTYNHAESFLLWRINGYFHLSDEQKGLAAGRLADLHHWHRQSELPRYAEFLRQVLDRWQDGLTGAEVDATLDAFEKLRAQLVERAAADGAVLLATVDAKQIRYLEQEIQRENRHWQSEHGTTPEERQAKRIKRVVGWIEDWLGRITAEQQQRLAPLIKEWPDTADVRLAYRVQRQQEFVRLLESKPAPAVIERRLDEWLAMPEKNAPPAYALLMQRSRGDIKRIVLELDPTVTPRQRAHASEKLQRLIRDIQALAAS